MREKFSIIRSVEMNKKKAKRLSDANHDLSNEGVRLECEIELGEICTSLMLSMDKVMNVVWRNYVESQERKPNVYFPVKDTEKGYLAEFQKYRLSHLSEVAPEIELIIRKLQPYYIGAGNWLSKLRNLANIRHESFPQINVDRATTIGIGGGGQDLYIKHMKINNGVVTLDAQAWNGRTGHAEAVKINFLDEIRAELADLGVDPFEFANLSAVNVERTIEEIFIHL